MAALEKSESVMDIITDNQYVRDTAQYLQSGGRVHKGKHFDLWTRIKQQIHKMSSIRWVKAHLRKENAYSAGVSYEDWFGNNEADIQAKSGACFLLVFMFCLLLLVCIFVILVSFLLFRILPIILET